MRHNQAHLANLADKIDTLCAKSPIIPVLTIKRLEDALPLAEALLAGGISVLEVTLRTEHGLAAITTLRETLPEASVGAGTVLDADQYHQAEAAGAQFIVTPGSTPELLAAGLQSDIPLLPGIATVSEMMQGIQLGYRRFKFFPAEIAGGAKALKAFAGPFGAIRFCPTGGINPDNARDYLSLPNVMCVGGTWVTPNELIDAKDWKGITEITRQSLAQLAD